MKRRAQAGSCSRVCTRGSSLGAVPEALWELIRISRAVGIDPDLVQGGGGNTSVKSRDGKTIFVKASGTSLARMDEGKGWAELDLDEVRGLLAVKGLRSLSPKARESKVLQLLAAAVIGPNGARPSVESNLHALLDRVVIHTHPVGLNALLCSRKSRGEYLRQIGRPCGEPLYVPYIDPGYVLASRMDAEIAAYRKRHGHPPAVVLLENHGLFVAAPEVEACLALSKKVTDAGQRFIGGRRVNPMEFPALAAGAPGRESLMAARVREALLASGTAACLVRRDDTPVAKEFLGNAAALRAAPRGAFSPDQIVYCRTQPLVLTRPGKSGPPMDAWARAAGAWKKRHRIDPRVVIVPGAGVFYAAPDLGQLRVVSEVYRGAMTAILKSRRTGGPRFLSRRQARFIEGWEVEAFRARLAAGTGKAFTGRIAVVRSGGDEGASRIARSLASAGATVFILAEGRKALLRTASLAGPSCIPVDLGPLGRNGAAEALRRIEASAGGIDFILD